MTMTRLYRPPILFSQNPRGMHILFPRGFVECFQVDLHVVGSHVIQKALDCFVEVPDALFNRGPRIPFLFCPGSVGRHRKNVMIPASDVLITVFHS